MLVATSRLLAFDGRCRARLLAVAVRESCPREPIDDRLAMTYYPAKSDPYDVPAQLWAKSPPKRLVRLLLTSWDCPAEVRFRADSVFAASAIARFGISWAGKWIGQ